MGTTTKVAIRIFSPRPALSGSRSGRGAGRAGAGGASTATGVAWVSVVVIGILASSPALHLTGSDPHNHGQGPMQIRLRNRRLRYRRSRNTKANISQNCREAPLCPLESPATSMRDDGALLVVRPACRGPWACGQPANMVLSGAVAGLVRTQMRGASERLPCAGAGRSRREIIIAGAIAYWREGGKNKPNRVSAPPRSRGRIRTSVDGIKTRSHAARPPGIAARRKLYLDTPGT